MLLHIFLMILLLLVDSNALASNRLEINDRNIDFHCVPQIFHDKNTAIFRFLNVLDKEELTWNKSDVAINSVELSWLVYLPDDNVHFGLDIIKELGGEMKGDFNLLKQSGEISYYEHNDSFMNRLPIASKDSISVIRKNLDLVIVVTRDSSTERLFDLQSTRANFWILGSGEMPKKCYNIINHYRGSTGQTP